MSTLTAGARTATQRSAARCAEGWMVRPSLGAPQVGELHPAAQWFVSSQRFTSTYAFPFHVHAEKQSIP